MSACFWGVARTTSCSLPTITLNWYVNLAVRLVSFALSGRQRSSGIHEFEAETPTLFVADCLIAVIDFFGGLILIYRCWIIWERNHVVATLPLMCATAGLGQ